jgi:hypothetical protein
MVQGLSPSPPPSPKAEVVEVIGEEKAKRIGS